MSQDAAINIALRMIDQATAPMNYAMNKVAQSTNIVERQMNKLDGVANSLRSTLVGIGVSLGAGQIIRTADAYQNLHGRLKLVTTSSSQLADTEKRLFESAQQSRTGYGQTLDLYARIARSTKEVGLSQGQMLTITDTINKTLVISGASAESANAALIQLGQGFASGTLRGEELNSVLEQAPRLAQAIADGMGVTIGRLRDLGKDGKLTAEAVASALIKQASAVNAEFADMPKTVGQAMVVVNNSLGRLIAGTDQAGGLTALLAGNIIDVAKGMDDWATANDKLIKQQLDVVVDDIGVAIDSIKQIYDWAPDWIVGPAGIGLVGGLLFGAKGAAVLAGGAVLGDWAKDMGRLAALASEGDVAWRDVILSGHDGRKQLLNDWEARAAGERAAIEKALRAAEFSSNRPGVNEDARAKLDRDIAAYQTQLKLIYQIEQANKQAAAVDTGTGTASSSHKPPPDPAAEAKRATELLKFRQDLKDRLVKLTEDAGERELAQLQLRHTREIAEAKEHGFNLVALAAVQQQELAAAEEKARLDGMKSYAEQKALRMKSYEGNNAEADQYFEKLAADIKDYAKSLDEIATASLPEQERAVYQVLKQYDALNAAIDKLAQVDPALGGISQEQADQFHDALGVRMQGDLDNLADKTKSTAEEMTRAFSGWANNLASDLNDTLWGAEFSFGKIAESFGRMLTQMAIQKKILEPLFSSLNNGLFGTSTPAGMAQSQYDPFASTAAGGIMGLLASLFHDGGVVGMTMSPSRLVPAEVFAGAPRYHSGLAGDEFPAILKRRESVLTPDQMRQLGPAGGTVIVNLIEAPGARNTGQVSRRQEGGANILDIYVEKIKGAIAADISRGAGPVPAAMATTYGLNRVPRAF